MAAAFGLHAIQLILAGNRTQRTQKEIQVKKTNRRNFLGRGAAAGAAAAAVALPLAARADDKPVKKVIYANGKKPDKAPLFNSTVTYGGLLFIAGVGAHVPGDVKSHTKIV